MLYLYNQSRLIFFQVAYSFIDLLICDKIVLPWIVKRVNGFNNHFYPAQNFGLNFKFKNFDLNGDKIINAHPKYLKTRAEWERVGVPLYIWRGGGGLNDFPCLCQQSWSLTLAGSCGLAYEKGKSHCWANLGPRRYTLEDVTVEDL